MCTPVWCLGCRIINIGCERGHPLHVFVSYRCRRPMVRTWRTWMLLLLRSHADLGKCETSCAAWASQSLLATCNHPLCGSCGAAIGCPRNAIMAPPITSPSMHEPGGAGSAAAAALAGCRCCPPAQWMMEVLVDLFVPRSCSLVLFPMGRHH